MLKHRLKKLEQGRGSKTAIFVMRNGKASGTASWNNQSWSGLTPQEMDYLESELESEGVEVLIVKVEPVEP